MSEYQRYEFQTIDRPLTDQQRKEVDQLSSRGRVSHTSATFEYHYSDFRHDSIEVMTRYFDAMLYVSSWGSIHLAFKFPKHTVDIEAIKQYRVTGLRIFNEDDFVLLEFDTSEAGQDDEYGYEEEFTDLSSLITLRNNILNGDYRCLYLFWLLMAPTEQEYQGEDEDENEDYYDEDENIQLEPPVPHNLQQLSGALHQFAELFSIDHNLIKAGGQESIQHDEAMEQVDYTSLIHQLSEQEKEEYLVRLLHAEPLLHVQLRKHLTTFLPKEKKNQVKRRSLTEIINQTKVIKQEEGKKAKQEQERLRLLELKRIASNQHYYSWERAEQLIQKKQTKPYEEAIEILVGLKKLAVYEDTLEDFKQKLQLIKGKYPTLTGFKNRLHKAKL